MKRFSVWSKGLWIWGGTRRIVDWISALAVAALGWLGGEGIIEWLSHKIEIHSETVSWGKVTGGFASRDFSGAIISSQDCVTEDVNWISELLLSLL